jgi:hypothetical protein
MTTTEDRLTDALHAAARSVTAPGLRPLGDAPEPRPVRADPRARRRRWLAAVASTAAVALIAGLVVAVSDRLHGSPRAAAGVPRYYAEISLPSGRLLIRATATGRVTATVPDPGPHRGQFQAVTTADDRTFLAEFVTQRDAARIYRFQLTPAGRAGRLIPVPGGNLGHDVAATMALSPSGSQLALAVRPSTVSARPIPYKVVVLSTRTGARTTWAGGRAPHGQDPRTATISQLSWTTNGRELVYLGYWTCSTRNGELCLDAGPLGGHEEVRTLNPASGGGTLTSGRLLLRSNGAIGAAAISPDGSVLTAVRVLELRRQHGRAHRWLIVTQFDARTGRRLRILYAVTTGDLDTVQSFVPGPSGRYLIVVGGALTDTVNGWIGHGRLHRLTPAGRYVSFETW